MINLTTAECDKLREQIVHVAVSNIGYGESEGNNRGPFLRAIGAPSGAEWCAYFAWYCYKRAAVHANLPMPFKGSGNAKRLGLSVLKCGNGFIIPPGEVLPGDLVVLHRGDSEYTGHVRVVSDCLPGGRRFRQIEGNSGPFPAKVRYRTTDIYKERLVNVYGLR